PVTPAPAQTPAPAITNHPATIESFIVNGPLKEEWMPLLKAPAIDPAKNKLASPPPGLAAAPAACDAFANRKASGAKLSCADPTSALAALAAALAKDNPADRDTALLDLEACTGLMPGVARALRAELAPIECGEAITASALTAPPPSMNGLVYTALLGQAI